MEFEWKNASRFPRVVPDVWSIACRIPANAAGGLFRAISPAGDEILAATLNENVLEIRLHYDAREVPLCLRATVVPPASVILSAMPNRVALMGEGRVLDEEWPLGVVPFADAECEAAISVTFSDSPVEEPAFCKETFTDIEMWRPAGENTNVGDCMPYSDGELYRIYYLFDRRHHKSKWGLGAHQWAQVSSKDLVHWETHPMAIGIDEQFEGSICTGSVIRNGNTYYAFYAVRMSDYSPARLTWATGTDGDHFTKSGKYITLKEPYTSTDDTTKIAKWSTASGKVVYAWNPIGNLAGNSNIENVYNGVIVKPGVFFGSFDGQGHTVSGMYINTNTEANTDCYKGFFGTFAGAAITNLRIVNAFTRGAGRNGTVAGMVYGMIPKDRAEDDWASYVAKGQYTDISFIYAEGIVTSYHTAGGQRYAGGLFGGVRAYDKKNDPHLSAEEQVGVVGSVIYIRNAEFSGTVDVGITQLADNSWPQYACAIAGWIAGYENTATDGNMFDIIFENVYAHANLLARFFVGAVGYAYRTDYEFINCVSTLTANVASNDYVGAFVAKREFPTGDANVKFQGKLIIKNSYYIPFDPDGQNFFRTPEGVKASEAAKAITVNPQTDLSGAHKVAALTEIKGLDVNEWIIGTDAIAVRTVHEPSYPASVWDGTVDVSWYNADDNVFTLTTASQLAGLAAIVNGTATGIAPDSFRHKTVNLAADMILNEGVFTYIDNDATEDAGTVLYNGKKVAWDAAASAWKNETGEIINAWTPIGNFEKDSNIESIVLMANAYVPGIYLGNFNGMGHTVSGLYVNNSAPANVQCFKGFFGVFGGTALKNLTIENSFVSGAGRTGTIAGIVYGLVAKDAAEDDWASYVEKGQCTLLENLHANGVVATYHTAGGSRYAGGLFGAVRAYDKGNDFDESVTHQVGATGSVIYLTRCSFEGVVDTGRTGITVVTGKNDDGSDKTTTTYPQFASGIVGWIAGYQNKATSGNMFDIIFDNVYSNAKLLAVYFAGGMVGYAYRTDYEFNNCVSNCTVSANSADYVGAFVGKGEYPQGDANIPYRGKLIITNSYYVPDTANGKNFFGTPEGIKASEAAKAITVNPETDLSGATKVTELTEIAGLDRAIWGVNENEVILSSVYFENPDDPTSTPIVPQPASEEPGEPGGDQPGEQPGEQPGTDPDPAEDNTTTPEPTPTVEPGAITTDATKGKKKGGCRSVVSAGTGVVVFVALFGIAITRKKEG